MDEILLLESDKGRAKFFSRRKELATVETVEWAAKEAASLLRQDLLRAAKLTATVAWLADALDDVYCRGRAARAIANLEVSRGKADIAVSKYEESIELFHSAGRPFDAAIACMSGLHGLMLVGDYDRASKWTAEARAVFAKRGDRVHLARLNLNEANLLFRRDRWEEAAVAYRDAYVELREIGTSQDVAHCLSNMAVCHLSMHNFQEAFALYQEARSFCESHHLQMLVAEIDYNIAYLSYLRGEYTEALDRYRRAKEVCVELGDLYHYNLCSLDEAEIFLELNLTIECADLAQKAYNGFAELSIRYESGKAMVLWGIAMSRQAKWYLALDLLLRAREIFSQEENQVWICQIDLHRSLVLLRAGRMFEAAKHARVALEGFRKLGLATKAAVCEFVVTSSLISQHKWKDAQDTVEEAIESLTDLDVPAVVYQAHYLLGEIHSGQNNNAAALAEYRLAHSNLERVRSHLQSEELKVPLLEDKLQVYERLFSLLADSSTAESKLEAFGYMEKTKARSIADLVASRAQSLPPRASGRSNLAAAVRKQREELNWYYRQIDLQEMRDESDLSESISPLRQASREHEHRLLDSLGQLQAADQELSSLQEAYTVDLSLIQATLSERTTVLEYYVAGTTLFAVVIDREGLEIFPLSVASRVHELQTSLRFQLAKFNIGLERTSNPSSTVLEALEEVLRALSEELISPVEHVLSRECLVVVPHGHLHYLPFHALSLGQSFLGDMYELTYSPSATVSYLLGLRPPPSTSGALVVGANKGQSQARSETLVSIAARLEDSKILDGTSATEKAFLEHASQARFVHLSAETSYRLDNPMFSAINLASGSLNLFDLFNLQLDTDLFSLAGCAPNLDADLEGDEFLGLCRGLLYAGARTLLVPLWNADDDSTLRFMKTFFRHLKEAPTKACALQMTTSEMRATDPNPFTWAPFVMVGDGS